MKDPGLHPTPFVQTVEQGSLQDAQPILGAAAEVDGGSIVKITGGAGDFTDLVTLVKDLREHLIVKDEVVRIRR